MIDLAPRTTIFISQERCHIEWVIMRALERGTHTRSCSARGRGEGGLGGGEEAERRKQLRTGIRVEHNICDDVSANSAGELSLWGANSSRVGLAKSVGL